MNTPTPTRDFLRRPAAARRRSVRQALAVIPNVAGVAISPGETASVEVSAMDNVFNNRQSMDSCSPVPSPDELVIQKRGRRRKSIVWSPDLDAYKRDCLFSLNSRERTPVKSPTKSTMVLRSTPRKRLSMGDPETRFTTPEKKKRSPLNAQKVTDTHPPQKQFDGSLLNGLRGLSHEQLVKMIMDLVSMQEEGTLKEGEDLCSVILKRMPVADIQPLREKLTSLRQNVYASLVSSNLDDSAYSRAYIHLDAFQKALVDQGKKLLDSQHWTSIMEYVIAAWNITKELPEWDNQGMHNTTRKCFKSLMQFCMHALKKGNFAGPQLDGYTQKMETMVVDCADAKICLQLLREAKHNED